MKSKANIEALEPRIAPASVFVTYTDIDGDLVKIIASKPGKVAPPLDIAKLTFVGGGPDGQLSRLDLTAPGFDGASITISATKKAGGDGLAHIGRIDASGVDLAKVIVKGDLGAIFAGDAETSGDPGLKLLKVRTMGALGNFSGSNLGSQIVGTLEVFKVAGDFTNVLSADEIGSVRIGGDFASGTINGKTIGTVRVSGSLIASVISGASVGDITIGGDLIGLLTSGGRIYSSGAMGKIFIGGSVIGGTGEDSGQIKSLGAIESVRIGGNLIGGAGAFSGQIGAGDVLGNVRVGGDVIGGTSAGTGQIVSLKAMGHVSIGGNLIGGSVTGGSPLSDAGEIFSAGRIASVTLGGSLIAGDNDGSAGSVRCGAIVAGADLGPVKIGGSILGKRLNAALIIASGREVPSATGFDTAIASLRVGGDVRYTNIFAGFSPDQMPNNADASIGAVIIGGDWAGVTIVAGAQNPTSPWYGMELEEPQPGGNPALIARIASIHIKGTVADSIREGDHFGIVAEQIDKLKIGSRTFALTAGPGNDSIRIPLTSDLRLFEVR